MLDWKQLVWLPEDQLARRDIAEVNLACAADLPGTQGLNLQESLQKIDDWAEKVRWYTVRHFRKFERAPHQFYFSPAYFRVLAMVTVLQRDCGVHYNLEKIPEDVPFAPADSFIFGITLGQGGTCATMPVVYVAIGRRLGYPMKLVAGKGKNFTHLFARWEGEGARFNIEATNKGLNCFPDNYYRSGIYEITPDMENKGLFLRSKTPREELTGFLMERFHCWKQCGRFRPSVEAAAWASALVPQNHFFSNTLKMALNAWLRALVARKPPVFPQLQIHAPKRRYPPTLPFDMERDILGLEATENLLNNPNHENHWWEPQRKGLRISVPKNAFVDFDLENCCRIRFRAENPAPTPKAVPTQSFEFGVFAKG